jgi:predicted transcriptional regulator
MQEKILINYENLVIGIINEYLDKNRTFEISKILPIISSRFAKSSHNINKNGIFEVLQSLARKKVIIEGSKFTKERVLSNQNRKNIYEYIGKTPGIYFNRLVKLLNLKPAIIEWHVNILIKFEFIKKEKIDNREAYFEFAYKFEQQELLHFLSREKYNKIIGYLSANTEGSTRTKMSKKLGMHPNTIKKYIKKLEEFKLVSKKKLSNKTLFFLNEDFYEKLITTT